MMSDESETIEHKLSLAERKEIVESVASPLGAARP